MGIASEGTPRFPLPMQQTLLALVAILVFSYFALSQHTAKASTERVALTAEVEMAGARVARQRLANVLARRFDEADADEGRVRTSPTGLSTLGPDTGETTEADYDDVDDVHGQPARTVTTEWMGSTLAFTDSVSVQYLDDDTLQPVVGPTLTKEVTVTVRAVSQGFIGRPPVAATLRQIVTPSS